MHTRNERTCRYATTDAKPWTCPTCKSSEEKYRNPRQADAGHTLIPDQCRYADPAPRTGAHPRDPRQTATDHPSAESSSLDATLRAEEPPPEVPPAFGEHGNLHPDPASSGGASSSADGAPRGRGPDLAPRERRTYAESGTGPTRLPDWSRFNIQVSLRNLRSYEPRVIQRNCASYISDGGTPANQGCV